MSEIEGGEREGGKVSADEIIPELCRGFFTLGWMTGTGGAIGLLDQNVAYITASSVQKERLSENHIFRYDINTDEKIERNIEHLPLYEQNIISKLTVSSCKPLFYLAFKLRGAKAVIHTHSIYAMMITLCYDDYFEISHQEMIKGIPGCGYTSTLRIPIIENMPSEGALEPSMRIAIEKKENEKVTAVLVRRHGVFVWGSSWEEVKIQCECLDYLFKAALKMKKYNVGPIVSPQ